MLRTYKYKTRKQKKIPSVLEKYGILVLEKQLKKIRMSFIDRELELLIAAETKRQEGEINLIASENYVPASIYAITGSTLTNKYAEGYPQKRYYAGCEVVDKIEQLAIDRCKALFGADHANVQPHSGSQANMVLYATLLKPGDTLMGMSLSAGGHLTHGHGVNFSGTFYKSVQYTVDVETEQLDYKAIEELAEKHKPKLIIAGASAYSRLIDFERMSSIAKNVGAFFAADIAHIAGLVAVGLHPSPVPHADIVSSTTHKTLRGPRGGFLLTRTVYQEKLDKAVLPGIQGGPLMHVIAAKAAAFKLAQEPEFKVYQQRTIINAQTMARCFQEKGYRIVAGGTDNHLFIVDLRSKGLKGLEAQNFLASAGITVSRSCIPFDPEKPWITSGIRIGTPAITTRGMGDQEVCTIVEWIDELLSHADTSKRAIAIAQEVKKLCQSFPIAAPIFETSPTVTHL